MISYLTGTIFTKGLNYLILMTSGGVGYKIVVPADIFVNTGINTPTSLYIHTHVKEDALDLYGFNNPDDLALFELLLGVSGIGPKTAIGVFGNGKNTKIKEAIVKGDVDFFTTVPRLGRKNAQKIIIDLRPKLGKLGDIDLTSENPENKEIIGALKTFGFNPAEANEALKSIKDIEADTSTKIRMALKYFGKK